MMKVSNGSDSELFIKLSVRQTVAIITGVLAYVFMGIWWAASTTTTLSANVTALEGLNAKVEANMDSRYRADDAERDFSKVYETMDEIRARLRELEKSKVSN